MVNNPKFPVLSDEVQKLKQTEGGLTAMCKVMEYYETIAHNEGIAKGRAEGCAEERRLIEDEMRQKDQELAALRAQLEALRNSGITPQNA